jgi:hypothetical protein
MSAMLTADRNAERDSDREERPNMHRLILESTSNACHRSCITGSKNNVHRWCIMTRFVQICTSCQVLEMLVDRANAEVLPG